MRKAVFFIFALVFSMSAFAKTTELGDAISKTLTKPQAAPVKQQAVFYSGKDISHSIVR